MRKNVLSLTAVLLVLCLVLTGCAGIDFVGYFQQLAALVGGGDLVSLEQMEYTRPDMAAFDKTLDDCCAQVETEIVLPELVEIIYEFYGVYDDFYTNLALAMIFYSKDQTDTYWEAEYNFCTENSARVDAGLDRFYRVLAKSPLREQLEGDDYFGAGYFDSYDGESLYDETFTELLNREAALENEYYSLMAQAGGDFGYTESFYATHGSQMEQLYVELIQVRQSQAEYAGYDNYPEFAYDFFHVRDYTPADATSYIADIRAELVPLYRQLGQDVGITLHGCTQEEMLAYVQTMANAMGGEIAQAFADMDSAGLYDISFSENKLDASFELYIRGYGSPFVFLNPSQTSYDKLTFAHEFGHFCNDYVSWGSGVGVDVSEIFSQGMEYLSLCYGPADENLNKLKLVDALCIYVEQAAYASFEQQVYGLEGEKLTVENVRGLYDRVCNDFGMEGGWSYVLIPHFFTEPMYVISYVVSNDAALQFYQAELEKSGLGLACFVEALDTTEPYFLAFLKEYGLESPFADGRLQEVKETLQCIFA